MTVQQVIDDHLVLITGQGDPQPNETTSIDPELIQAVIGDLRIGGFGRRICYFDKETNSIKDGIQFRKRSETISGR